MENKVLLMLLKYDVKIDENINNIDNINRVSEKMCMDLFFIYSILANYRSIDVVDIPEIKDAVISKLYSLYGNYIKLKLQKIDSLYLYKLEAHPMVKSSVNNKLNNYFIQVMDSLLDGKIKAEAVSNIREAGKIVDSCVDIVLKTKL